MQEKKSERIQYVAADVLEMNTGFMNLRIPVTDRENNEERRRNVRRVKGL